MKAVFRNRLTDDAGQSGPNPTTKVEPRTKDLLEVFWRGRWMVLLSVVICLGVAMVYLKKATPQYTSSSRIFIEQSGPKIIAVSDGLATQQSNYLATQAEVLKSTTITSIAVESRAFENMKTFRGLDNPVGLIKADLNVELGRNNDIVTISFTGPYPAESADVVNRLVDAYKTYQSRQKHSTAAEVLKILQQEKDKREAELEAKLQEKLEFMKANSNLVFQSDDKNGDRASPVLQRLAALTEALTAAQLATFDARANYELAKATAADPAKLRQIMLSQTADPVTGAKTDSVEAQMRMQLRTQLRQAQEELQDAQQRLLPKHPHVLALEARVASLRDEIDNPTSASEPLSSAPAADASADPLSRFATMYVALAEQRWQAAVYKEKQLQTSFGNSLAEQQKAAVDSNNKAATYAIMEADYRRIEKLCDQLQSRISEIHVTEDSGAMNVTVLEWAKPSGSPSKPDHVRTLTVALLLGLSLGFAIAFTMAWTDHRLRSADDVQATLGLAVLGAVPVISGQITSSIRGRKVQLEPNSDVAEAYRTIRTGIYFGVTDGRSKLVLITSPQPGDGKSTVASNLAIAMAQAGQRTLLLDGDFRRPTQHKIFGLPSTVGLSSVLIKNVPLSDAILPSGITNLDIFPCGPIPSNPAEMLNSDLFADLIAKLSEEYDQIIFDSPPVLPVTDARILSAICDTTILVLRAEKSTRKLAAFACDMLRRTGAEISGAVINGVPRRHGGYGYGYGYYYGYRYTSRKEGDANGNTNGNGHAAVLAHSDANGNGNGSTHAVTGRLLD